MAINAWDVGEYAEAIKAATVTGGANTQQLVNIINKYNLSPAEFAKFVDEFPNVVIEQSAEKTAEMLYGSTVVNMPNSVAEEALININSNLQTGTNAVNNSYNVKTALSTVVRPDSDIIDVEATVTDVATGSKVLGFVGEVSQALGAVATGLALGKGIDKIAYETGFNWGESFGLKLEDLDPAKWNTIAFDEPSTGTKVLNFILGLNPDTGESKAYMDETALGYIAKYLDTVNYLDIYSESATYNNYQDLTYPNNPQPVPYMPLSYVTYKSSEDGESFELSTSDSGVRMVLVKARNDLPSGVFLFSRLPFVYRIVRYSPSGEKTYDSYVNSSQGPESGISPFGVFNYAIVGVGSVGIGYEPVQPYVAPQFSTTDIAKILFKGVDSTTGVYGTYDTPDAVKPDLSDAETVDDAVDALKEQYPALWSNAVTQSIVQPDGTTKTKTYVPVPLPAVDGNSIPLTTTEPVTGTSVQGNPTITPTSGVGTISSLLKLLYPNGSPHGSTGGGSGDGTPTDDTGSGDTPPVVLPVGSANALYSIYNPTQSELNSLGAWLWSPNFIDQLLKMFSDPMQAIIGLHKVFVSPPVNGYQNIKVGYLDSGVGSNTVGSQYTSVNLGSANLREYFGNVFDYEGTKVKLYIPFIGIIPLSVSDVMRSTISVTFKADVLTGACLAEVKVVRDNSGGVLYTYSGNCAVQYPVSSGSYIGLLQGGMGALLNTGLAISNLATGNIVGGARHAVYGAMSMSHMKTDVQHSGSFTGSSGAMGAKKPYLIVERPQPVLATTFPEELGYPSNKSTKLSNCSGYVRINEVHTDGIANATKDECAMIESLLKDGVHII